MTRMLTASHSHLFRGARLSGATAPGPCALAFVDGTRCMAELGAGPEGPVLSVPGHRTGAGTDIAAARWQLAPAPGGWRVTGRA